MAKLKGKNTCFEIEKRKERQGAKKYQAKERNVREMEGIGRN